MSCETVRNLIDNEDRGLADHVRSCLSCLISESTPYYAAPHRLEEKIRRSLRKEANTQPHWRTWAIAASLVLVASVGGNLTLVTTRVNARQVTTDAMLSAHLRSLAGTHLLDVLSSDQHTVKPWFNGKLDFSPSVQTVAGFPLLGGRLEYFDSRPAAALIYGRNKHIINLLTWPSTAAGQQMNATRNGYHLENWSNNGMTFWAVSDLDEEELRQFVSLYRNQH